MLREAFQNLKRLLCGQPAPGRPEPVNPTPCQVCGDVGFYAVRNGWLCESCYPSILRLPNVEAGR